jgi:hypothetical protein
MAAQVADLRTKVLTRTARLDQGVGGELIGRLEVKTLREQVEQLAVDLAAAIDTGTLKTPPAPRYDSLDQDSATQLLAETSSNLGLGGQPEVVGGVADRGVAHVGLQDRQQRADVLARGEPRPQGADREGVPLMRNSALAALCGRLGYVPCHGVSAAGGGGAGLAVRIILGWVSARASRASRAGTGGGQRRWVD